MDGRLVRLADVNADASRLAAREPHFARALAQGAAPELRRRPGGYPGLLRIVVGQQISTAAAAAIWARVEAGGAGDPAEVRAMAEGDLRALGLTGAKAAAAKAIAEADPDFASIAETPDTEAMAHLTALRGVGPWTAEVYLMFCEGRRDIFAPGDLALREAARDLFGLPDRPDPKGMARLAEAWSPWRGAAARILWSWYRVIKGRSGV